MHGGCSGPRPHRGQRRKKFRFVGRGIGRGMAPTRQEWAPTIAERVHWPGACPNEAWERMSGAQRRTAQDAGCGDGVRVGQFTTPIPSPGGILMPFSSLLEQRLSPCGQAKPAPLLRDEHAQDVGSKMDDGTRVLFHSHVHHLLLLQKCVSTGHSRDVGGGGTQVRHVSRVARVREQADKGLALGDGTRAAHLPARP